MEAILTVDDEKLVADIALRMSEMALKRALSVQTVILNDLIQNLVKSGAMTANDAAKFFTQAADRNSVRLAETDNPLLKVMNASVEQFVEDLLFSAEALQFGGSKNE
jgi:hypothetical protein